MTTTNNEFTIECRVREARSRIRNIAEDNTHFDEFEREVLSDKAIMNLMSRRHINTLIQEWAADLI